MARYSVDAVPVPAEPESLEFPRCRRLRTWCPNEVEAPMRGPALFERRRLLMDEWQVCLRMKVPDKRRDAPADAAPNR